MEDGLFPYISQDYDSWISCGADGHPHPSEMHSTIITKDDPSTDSLSENQMELTEVLIFY